MRQTQGVLAPYAPLSGSACSYLTLEILHQTVPETILPGAQTLPVLSRCLSPSLTSNTTAKATCLRLQLQAKLLPAPLWGSARWGKSLLRRVLSWTFYLRNCFREFTCQLKWQGGSSWTEFLTSWNSPHGLNLFKFRVFSFLAQPALFLLAPNTSPIKERF